jgi:uncharacterized protein (TIGR02246 family)
MLLLVALAAALVAASAREGKPPPEDPAHKQLRILRDELVEAVNKQDIDALLTHLDKNIVVTWLDGQVSKGPQEVREYIEKMTKGENRKVNSYKTKATVEDLTHLYGDTGVAFGHSDDQFVLTDGRELDVNTRWTATLVKKDGKWKLAAFHASTDMFDNPVLRIAVKRIALWAGGIAGAAGLVIGLIIAFFFRRRKQPAPPSPQP